MSALTYTTLYTLVTCCECGIGFAMPDLYYQERKDDHRTFYCPSGHKQYFPEESEEERLRRQLRSAEVRRISADDQRRAAERSANALRGHLTRLRNRIAAGVCPWCRRHFADVQRHVGTKHPEHIAKMHEALS